VERAHENLINWKVSGQHELKAKTVMCITPNLVWARIYEKTIRNNLAEYPDKEFQYIVFDNRADLNSEVAAALRGPGNSVDKISNWKFALESGKFILSNVKNDKRIQNPDRIRIVFLTKDSLENCVWTPTNHTKITKGDDWLYLPLPTDLAVYKDTPSNLNNTSAGVITFAVMSVVPVADVIRTLLVEEIKTTSPGNLYSELDRESVEFLDVQLRREEHYLPIVEWFGEQWNARSRDKAC
jgi:hypothetical protein